MNHIIILAGIIIAASFGNAIAQHQQKSADQKNNLLFPKGRKITNNNFTGIAYLQVVVAADSLNPTAVGNVTFDPGARTKWHSHPGGQILLVTDGVGYYQEKGQAKKVLRRGDVIKCPPDVTHWHGASADTAFIQVAITNNTKGAAVWYEAVSEDDYRK